MLRSTKPRLSWNERLHRLADRVNVLWVVGITAFFLFVVWIIGRYDLWIVAVLGSILHGLQTAIDDTASKWTRIDTLWLIILAIAIYWIGIGIAKVGDTLMESIKSLEQKITDLEWTINDQKKKIEGITNTLHHQHLMSQRRPNMYTSKK